MNSNLLTALVLLFLLTGFSATYFFHEGGVDKRGGHFNAEDNTYHYHHGCKAHLHEEGKCEFEFKNCKREENSNTTQDSHPIQF